MAAETYLLTELGFAFQSGVGAYTAVMRNEVSFKLLFKIQDGRASYVGIWTIK